MRIEELETWWIPITRHWKTDDKSWMKERRAIWDIVKNNAIDDEVEPDALAMKGLRNFFFYGYSMLENPPHSEFWEVSRKMYVSSQKRLALSPFSEPTHYNEFIDAVLENISSYEVCDVISNPLTFVDKYLKDTGLEEQRVLEIYKYILGNGMIFDNRLISGNSDVYEIYDAPINILKYFDKVSRFLNLDKNRGGDWSHIGYYGKLFDYYASHAEFAVETMSRYKERRCRYISRLSLSVFNDFKNKLDAQDQFSIDLYDKSREFIFGERLPKEMRID